jgi:hypothetical protein
MEGQPVRIRFSPLGYVAVILAGLAMAAMIGLLVAQLKQISDQKKIVAAQDAKVAQLQRASGPVLRESVPLLRQTQPLLRDAQPLLRTMRVLIGPAASTLANVDTAAGAIPRLVAGTDVLLADAIPLVQSLVANGRTVRVIDASNRMLAQLEQERLIPRTSEALPRFELVIRQMLETQLDLLRVQTRTFRTQARGLRLQFRAFALQQEALAVARETLQHVRSIDQKTGGQLPVTGRVTP